MQSLTVSGSIKYLPKNEKVPTSTRALEHLLFRRVGEISLWVVKGKEGAYGSSLSRIKVKKIEK